MLKKCRMCATKNKRNKRKLYYIFTSEFSKYVEYLCDYKKTPAHRRDNLPRYLCRSCMDFLDDHYEMKKRHDERPRTCQRLPEAERLNLVDEPYRQPSEDLDLQPLWQIPETQNSGQNNSQSYHCAICNHEMKDKALMIEHISTKHVIKCVRCRVHCPFKLRYSKVTVYTNPEINSVLAEVLMGTSGEFSKNPIDLNIRTDRVLPMPSDDVAEDTEEIAIDVAYKCHTCKRDFISSWKIEQHIRDVHLDDSFCKECAIHCRKTWREQVAWFQRMENTELQDARNEVHYMVGLTHCDIEQGHVSRNPECIFLSGAYENEN